MQPWFLTVISRLRKIEANYTGGEPTFSESLKKMVEIDSRLIRVELSCDRSGYQPDCLRAAAMELLPQLEKLRTMDDLRRFLKMPGVIIFQEN